MADLHSMKKADLIANIMAASHHPNVSVLYPMSVAQLQSYRKAGLKSLLHSMMLQMQQTAPTARLRSPYQNTGSGKKRVAPKKRIIKK